MSNNKIQKLVVTAAALGALALAGSALVDAASTGKEGHVEYPFGGPTGAAAGPAP